MIVVFAIIAVALVLFVTELIPIDVTAIAILFVRIVLGPWTGIDPATGVGRISSSATITVPTMFILSEGIRQSVLINSIGARITTAFGESPFKHC